MRNSCPSDNKVFFDPAEQYGYQESADREADWNKMLKLLVEYKNDTGLLIVSTKDDSNKKLRKWIETQRTKERNGTILPERKQKLLDVGFIFRPNKSPDKKHRFTLDQRKKWNVMYNKLCAFKEQHDHCNVRFNDIDTYALAKWAGWQRYVFSMDKMDEARRQRLDAIRFNWDGTYCQKCPETDARDEAEEEDYNE